MPVESGRPAVAAALEDPGYPIEDLIVHLANLRAGHRFELDDSLAADDAGSERLAMACRQAYGPVDYEGYLRLGVPVGYGEGAAEAVQAWLRGDAAFPPKGAADFEFGPGDVERAYVEWLSLLRHSLSWRGPPWLRLPRPVPSWRRLIGGGLESLRQPAFEAVT